ncbi:unnamed protein product [Eretmochelys imbricata]
MERAQRQEAEVRGAPALAAPGASAGGGSSGHLRPQNGSQHGADTAACASFAHPNTHHWHQTRLLSLKIWPQGCVERDSPWQERTLAGERLSPVISLPKTTVRK